MEPTLDGTSFSYRDTTQHFLATTADAVFNRDLVLALNKLNAAHRQVGHGFFFVNEEIVSESPTLLLACTCLRSSGLKEQVGHQQH